MLSPPDGRCRLDEQSAINITTTPLDYVLGVAARYTSDGSVLSFSNGTAPSFLNQSRYISSMFSASAEVSDAAVRFRRGLTTTSTEVIKHTMYTAALLPTYIEADSFTEPFKAAALALVNGPSPSTAAMAFIFRWGNFIFDRAALGAVLYRSFFTQPDATDTFIQRAKATELFGDLSSLLARQDMATAQASVLPEYNRRLRYEVSKPYRVGELVAGSTCDIGGGTTPQVRVGPTR